MKKIIALLTVVFVLSISLISVSASKSLPCVIDNADLLSSAEEIEIGAKLEDINKRFGLDIVILTVDTIGEKTLENYADDYYDNNGYGKNGALLLVAVEEGERYVSTIGSCIDKINVDELGDQISSYLDSKSYAIAFEGFADYVEEAYSFKWLLNLAICFGIGLLIAFIAVSSMKGKLKSVRMQTGAANYVKVNSMKLTTSRDVFLYRTVTSRARPKSNNGGTHTSSSGRTHGGGRI